MRHRAIIPSVLAALPALLASCDGGTAPAPVEALSRLDFDQKFGDFTRAERWYIHYNLPRVNSTVQEVYQVLVPLVEDGDLFAIKVLGKAYSQGSGPFMGKRDDEKSFKLYRLGAAEGDPECMAEVGYKYLYGNHVERDYRKALEWLERAFELGHAGSAHGIAAIHRHGYGPGNVPKNERLARQWEERIDDLLEEHAEKRKRGEDVPPTLERRLKALVMESVGDGRAVLERYNASIPAEDRNSFERRKEICAYWEGRLTAAVEAAFGRLEKE